ncbi:hypothetical protein CDD82_403 [Ophiocordyceps australis]|uniref:Domain of unknown function at the cortex 1 domain-containing protein n=1 Tax=Ophiocordyceps australis TaxID=1399860 RepID=A0A2C5YNN4_9HYPO|nr:hypothetical protein CDD82_403 [Ophiocordyceps australis]
MADKYILRVTAGPDYDEASHVEVPVNRAAPVRIQSSEADIELNVRIRDYQGLPRGSPTTSAYFATEPHAYNQDQYSISFRFTPRRPVESGAKNGQNGRKASMDDCDGIRATDLQFGNDFDRPIRDRLPPGFSTAMSIVKWWIDPGLDGDAYADKPHLYGPALSSFNVLCLGAGEYDEARGGLWFDEGGDESGMQTRRKLGMPDSSKARMKWALKQDNKQKFVFSYGRTYGFDFYNPYLDFSKLSLRLPGFQLPMAKYWDGQGLRKPERRSHELRYVLRDKRTAKVYLVVLITIYLREDVGPDGTIAEGAAARAAETNAGRDTVDDRCDETRALKEARDRLGGPDGETRPDDVD